MKKLMTMIAAAAMAFGLYADGPLNDVWDATQKTTSDWNTPAQWTVPDGAAVFTGDTAAQGNKLTLKTSGAIVSRDIEGATAFSNTSNVYFDVQLDLLGQALDELPAADQLTGAKLALFVLDNTELGATSPSTALYALGYNYDAPGYKALYQLGTSDTVTTLTNGNRRLTLNAYNNVLASAVNGHAGFTVYLDGAAVGKTPLTVTDVFWFTDNTCTTVDWATSKMSAYLGTGVTSTVPAINWFNNRNLVLALFAGQNGQQFNDIGFAGNAAVTVATITETKPPFIGADFSAMKVTLADGITISSANPIDAYDAQNSVITKDCVLTLTSSIDKPVYTAVVVGGATATVEGNTVTVQNPESSSLDISVSEAKATVTIGGTTYNFANIGEAIKKANGAEAAATIKLYEDAESETALTFNNQNFETVLDLAGQTITFTDESTALVNSGKLKIIDSGDNGKVVAYSEGTAVLNTGSLKIEDGIFVGAVGNTEDLTAGTLEITGGVFNYEVSNDAGCTLTVKGGEFSTTAYPEAKDVPVADGYEATDEGATTGYWLVREKAKTYSLTIDDDIEGGEVTTDPGAGELAADTEVKVTATADTGYTLETITTNGQALAGDTFLMPAEAVEVSATFAAKAYKLNATAGENTTLTKDPEKTTYAYNETVVLTAALASGDYEWDQIPTGWTQGDNDTYTLTYTILDEDVESGNVVATPTAKTKAAPLPDPIKEGNDEQKEAYAKWAQDNNITDADPINAVAFALNVSVAHDIEKDVQDALDDVLETEPKAAAEVAKFSDDYTPDYFDVEAYPNATFIFVETKEIEAENGRFFRLKAEFKPLP